EFPELTKKGIPVTGMESYGGPLATAGGLVFIAGTRDEMIRAFDKRTGKVVWQYHLPAAGFATPITYMVNGVQYIAIAAGGGRGLKTGGDYVAFALPRVQNAATAPNGPGGWILVGLFVVLALLFRRSPALMGVAFTLTIVAAV